MSKNGVIPVDQIKSIIFLIRGQKVMLSPHLAELYNLEPRVLVQAVKRNIDRFPGDFMFQLSEDEFADLKSQIVTSSWGGPRRAKPYAFTEQGVAMLSSVLRSKRAVQVNIEIMRAFVRLRQLLTSHTKLAGKLLEMEKKYDEQFKIVFEAIRQLMAPTETKKKKIGFTIKEKQKAYGKSMAIKALDKFSLTPQAFRIWINIPGDIQIKILNDVWCKTCSDTTGIGNVNGKIEKGMLILKGICTRCGNPVARVIENE
ncbi:MAG: ORF6N domain-containing protein [Deltaproteobacteria bacterium]|nr:ORF6N domain-containing protein [Deltaproteobacteria bacterium]